MGIFMKLGNWIQVSAMLLAGISATSAVASSTTEKTSLTDQEFLEAVTKIQTTAPSLHGNSPCFSVPTHPEDK
jgi:hypothetical protein